MHVDVSLQINTRDDASSHGMLRILQSRLCIAASVLPYVEV